jgi:CubicO group peptidase (beta-lactamase class C family)
MNSESLKQAELYAFTRTGDEKDRKGIRTDGLVIIRNGRIVLERYARGYQANTPHLAWSVSKSFVNALYGIAVRKKMLDVEAPAYRYYPALNREQHRDITVRHLLQMASGLDWNEGYEASPLKSSVIAMLYTRGRDDMAQFAANPKLRYKPGTRFYYSSGTSNLLMAMLRDITTPQQYESFIWQELFERIGMRDVTWERDQAGTFVGSSYIYASPRQLAKFGYLYLNDGIWDNQRILPEGWVKFSTTASPADAEGIHGAHWWLNVGRPKHKIPPDLPAAPADMISARGHWGQIIFVIPSLDLVIVRTADDRERAFDRNKFLKLVIDSIEQQRTKTGAKQ